MPIIAKKTKTEEKPLSSRVKAKKPVLKNVVEVKSLPLKKVNTIKEYSSIFNIPQNAPLVHQYLRTYMFNQRSGNAKTKTRGEVAGSGRKPWKQKGTGRARVGSVRNPVWRHGGVSHGPVLKDWSLSFPRKMKFKTFYSLLSQKATSSNAYYIDKIVLTEGRTKDARVLIDGWGLNGPTLIVVFQRNEELLKGTSNLQNIDVVNYRNLNPYQIISHTNVVFEKEALDKLVDKYAKKGDF